MGTLNRQRALNHGSPAAARAKTGDVLADLIAQVNALTAANQTLVAKLNADAGVADTNYVAVTNTVIKDLESR